MKYVEPTNPVYSVKYTKQDPMIKMNVTEEVVKRKDLLLSRMYLKVGEIKEALAFRDASLHWFFFNFLLFSVYS